MQGLYRSADRAFMDSVYRMSAILPCYYFDMASTDSLVSSHQHVLVQHQSFLLVGRAFSVSALFQRVSGDTVQEVGNEANVVGHERIRLSVDEAT